MSGKGRSILLWVVAGVVMLSAAAWQRYSGPTYPARPSFTFGGTARRAKLVRSGTTGESTVVRIPAPASADGAVLAYRRYPTDEPWTEVPMTRDDEGDFTAPLPSQPRAGKLEYSVTIRGAGEEVRVPAAPETVVLRYKGHVPIAVLLPHVLLMFLAMLFGVRTALAAVVSPGELRTLVHLTLAGMTLGGMILGPIVQKFAFGAFWTGFPFGYDLTDNKTLLLWLGWLAAAAVLRYLPGKRRRIGRVAVVAAAVVMLGVYLVPHSLRGSELDYAKLKKGVTPAEAVKTG